MIQGANQEVLDKGLKADKIDKKKWRGGVLLNVIAGLFDSVALAFTAQSLISILSGLALVLNALIIPCYNEHELRQMKKSKFASVTGGVIIFFGTLLCVFSADHRPTAYSSRELEIFFSESLFVGFEVTTLLITVYFEMILKCYPDKANLRKQITMLTLYGFAPAWCGAVMNMMLKADMEIIKSSFKGESSLVSADFLMNIVCIIALAVAQLLLINRGLHSFGRGGMKFLGFYQTVMMAMGVMNGALFYGEFDGFGVGQWVCFVIGFVVIVWGMLIITFLGEPREHADDTPTLESCSGCHSRYVCGIFDEIVVENPMGKFEPVRQTGYKDRYDDGI